MKKQGKSKDDKVVGPVVDLSEEDKKKKKEKK